MGLDQSKNVFKQIFIDHWAEFLEMNREYQAEYYDTVIKKMLGCGDPENGFISYRCLQCGEVKGIPFSCKSSFCLSCAKIYLFFLFTPQKRKKCRFTSRYIQKDEKRRIGG